MTASILENTRPASYKGVPFLVEGHKATEGRNNATFLYINSGRRAFKDLGGFPFDGSITAFTHSTDGRDYAAKRDALRRVLNEPTSGKLVHPFLENMNIKPGKFSYVENFSELGICRFEIPFEVVDDDAGNPLVPNYALSNPAKVKALALAANRALQKASADSFEASTNLNKECTKSHFSNAANALKGKLAKLGNTIAKVSAFAGKALAISQQAAYYANNPLVGFAALADGLLGVDGLTMDVFAKFKAFEALFTFGDDGDEFSVVNTIPKHINPYPATAEDAERGNNADIMTTFIQGGALIEAMAQAGNTKYGSTDEINLYYEKVEEQFQKITDAMTKNEEPERYNFATVRRPDYTDAYSAMSALRQSLNEYMDSQRLSVPKIDIIKVSPQPATVLAYTLYGDSTRALEIMELNGLTDNMNVSGEIRVLSA